MVLRSFLAAALTLFVFVDSAALADPVVANVNADQLSGTKLANITYEATAETSAVTMSLLISRDGAVTFEATATALRDALGAEVVDRTSRIQLFTLNILNVESIDA